MNAGACNGGEVSEQPFAPGTGSCLQNHRFKRHEPLRSYAMLLNGLQIITIEDLALSSYFTINSNSSGICTQLRGRRSGDFILLLLLLDNCRWTISVWCSGTNSLPQIVFVGLFLLVSSSDDRLCSEAHPWAVHLRGENHVLSLSSTKFSQFNSIYLFIFLFIYLFWRMIYFFKWMTGFSRHQNGISVDFIFPITAQPKVFFFFPLALQHRFSDLHLKKKKRIH